MAKLIKQDLHFNRWDAEFSLLEKAWVDWCKLKANKYSTVSRAWAEFIAEQQQKSLQFSRLENFH